LTMKVLCLYGAFFIGNIVAIFSLNPKTMSILRYLLISILIFTSFSGCAQNQVFLKWKLAPAETITYKTIMKETDTANNIGLSFNGLGKMMGDSNANQFKNILGKLNNLSQGGNLITTLKESRRNIIDIEMKLVSDKHKAANDTSAGSEFRSLINQMSAGIMLRGAIHEDGTIESFYTADSQKNLIANFFELPGKPVKVGDSWPLDIHFISTDQYFKCDSSFKRNKVTVVSITNKDGDTDVVLNYDILEFVHGNEDVPLFGNHPIETSMKFGFKGVAVFSIEKGRWISFDGVLSESSSGMMSSRSAKKCSLLLQ